MINFRCFAELPELNPASPNGWENRAQYDTNSVLAMAERGELTFTENCQQVLKELEGMKFDPAYGCATESSSLNVYYLRDLHYWTREALAVVLMWEANGAWQFFTINDTLKNSYVLHALCALPIVIQIAGTFNDYRDVARAIEAYCSGEEELISCIDDNGEEFFCVTEKSHAAYQRALLEFNCSVEANGQIYRICEPVAKNEDGIIRLTGSGEDAITFQWGSEAEVMRDKLLEKREDMPIPLEPVQEKPIPGVGDIDGVPVLGCLVFNPDRWFGPGRGLLTIVHSANGLTTTEDSIETTRSLKTLCESALSRAKEKDATVVSLVTTTYMDAVQDYSVLNNVLYCITATPAAVMVSDHRAALKEFADAIEKYLL